MLPTVVSSHADTALTRFGMGVRKKVLCPTHKAQVCASCDAPVTAQDATYSSGDVAMADSNGSVSVDFPFRCFFPVGTTFVHLMWHPQKPRVHKVRNDMDSPCWEAKHGGREIATPTPNDSHLIRADAGSVLVLQHARWGRFALAGDKEGGAKEKAEVFGWYMVPRDPKMVDMSILVRAGATIQAVDKSVKPQEDTYWCTCHQVCAMGVVMCCCSVCNRGCNMVPYCAPYFVIRGRDQVPYRASYRAIGCAIRHLVAHVTLRHSAASGGTRCILHSLLLHPCSHIHPSALIFSGDCSPMAPFGPCAST